MNNFKIKLKIGEFSKLCFVTVKTLRHYEKMGLLMPHEVDEWTGYRYYDVSQIDELVNIQRLKQLGLSLEEIHQMQEDGTDELTPQMIDNALSDAEQELCNVRRRIEDLSRMKGLSTKQNLMENIVIKPLPGGTVACCRKRLKSYDELGPLCVNVIAPEMQRLGCECPPETAYCYTIDYNKNYNPEDLDIEYCEIVSKHNDLPSEIVKFKDIPVVEKAVCLSHFGDYVSFWESVTQMMKFIEEHKLNIAGHPRFSYIHGIWDRDNVADWLTEIQWPVE